MIWEEQGVSIRLKKKLVLSQVSIYDVFESYGIKCSHDKIVCPFPDHNDGSPSLIVYGDTNSFYCFGCSKGSNVIDFVMLMDGCDFVTAVKKLMPMRKDGVNFAVENRVNLKDAYAFDMFCRLRDFLKGLRGFQEYDDEVERVDKVFALLDAKLAKTEVDNEERLRQLNESVGKYIEGRVRTLNETVDGYGKVRI